MNTVKQEETDHIDIDVKIEYLMDIKREEGYFDDLNEEEGGVGRDDVGGSGVVVKEEVEEVVEEVDDDEMQDDDDDQMPIEDEDVNVEEVYGSRTMTDDNGCKRFGWKDVTEDDIKMWDQKQCQRNSQYWGVVRQTMKKWRHNLISFWRNKNRK